MTRVPSARILVRVVRFALLVVAALLVGVPTADAQLRTLLPLVDRVEFLESDLERFAVWGTIAGTRLRGVDTRTGKRFAWAKPRDCHPLGYANERPAAHGRVLLICPAPGTGWRSFVVDLRSGRRRALPVRLPGAPGGEIAWHDLGRRWVEGSADDCSPSVVECRVLLRLSDGARRIDSTSLRRYDLDRVALRPLRPCAALAELVARSDGVYRDRALLAYESQEARGRAVLVLRRCDDPLGLRVTGRAATPELGGGWASWSSGLPVETAALGTRIPRTAALTALSLARGRRLAWRIPARRTVDCRGVPFLGALGAGTHTRHAVFWASGVSAEERVAEDGCEGSRLVVSWGRLDASSP